MSKEKSSNSMQLIKRCSYEEYGLTDERVAELQDGCRAGKYPSEVLRAACKGIEVMSPWILLSVRQGKSFDALAVAWELGQMERPPYSRTDFYSYRRRFFANLDMVLKEKAQGESD